MPAPLKYKTPEEREQQRLRALARDNARRRERMQGTHREALLAHQRAAYKLRVTPEFKAAACARAKAWYEANKERAKANARVYRRTRPALTAAQIEKRRAKNRRDYIKHAARRRAACLKYYHEHIAERRQYHRQYKLENTDKVRAYKQRPATKENDRKSKQRCRERITPGYVRDRICAHSPILRAVDLPADLVSAKQAEIKLRRLLNEQDIKA